jgi:hypothetical protein
MDSNFLYMRNHPFLVNGLNSLILEAGNYLGSLSEAKMVEVGSYLGESTIIFANHFREVSAIDPFVNDYDSNDPTCNHADLNIVYEAFKQNTLPFKNINHFRLTSDSFFESCDCSDVDFFYIDGVHTYAQTKKDILNCLAYKGRKKIVISGHDFSHSWSGVMDAVNETLGTPDMCFEDTSWIKFL